MLSKVPVRSRSRKGMYSLTSMVIDVQGSKGTKRGKHLPEPQLCGSCRKTTEPTGGGGGGRRRHGKAESPLKFSMAKTFIGDAEKWDSFTADVPSAAVSRADFMTPSSFWKKDHGEREGEELRDGEDG